MLDTPQNFFIVIVALACSLFFMAAVNYYWPAESDGPTTTSLVGNSPFWVRPTR